MILHAARDEGWTTALGALALLLLTILTALPRPISATLLSPLGGAFLFQGPILVVVELLCTAALFYGLFKGFIRHKDFTPILFGLLGVSMLLVSQFTSLSPLLIALCGISILIAALWDVLSPSMGSFTVAEIPSLETFLDTCLTPPDDDR